MAFSNQKTNNVGTPQQAETLYRFHPEYGFIEVPNQANSEPYTEPFEPYAESFEPFAGPFGQQFANTAPPFCNIPLNAPYGRRHAMHMNAMQAQMNQIAQYAAQATQAAQAASMATQNLENSKMTNTPLDKQVQNAGLSPERINEIYNMVDDVVNGKAEPTKLLGILQDIPGEFWKGLAIGAGAMFLFKSTAVKDLLATTLGGLIGAAGMAQANNDDLDDGFDDESETEIQNDNSENKK